MTTPESIKKIKPSYMGPASYGTRQSHNNNLLKGPAAMPFKPNTASGASSFSQGRSVYRNIPKVPTGELLPAPCTFTSRPISAPSKLPRFACTKTTKVKDVDYIAKKTLLAAHSSSDIIARKKATAIGKGSGMTLKNTTDISYTNRSSTQQSYAATQALRRLRGSGNVPPPKVSAISNPFKSGGGCC